MSRLLCLENIYNLSHAKKSISNRPSDRLHRLYQFGYFLFPVFESKILAMMRNSLNFLTLIWLLKGLFFNFNTDTIISLCS